MSETLLSYAEIDDRVRVTLTGKLHLSLLSNMTYIASCAENINFKNSEIMMRISRRLSLPNYLSKICVYLNAKDAIEYLLNYRTLFLQGQDSFLSEKKCISIYNIQDAKNSLEKWETEDPEIKNWIECSEKYIIGTIVEAEITKKDRGALICRFDEHHNLKGFLSTTDEEYGLSNEIYHTVEDNNIIRCSIIEYDLQHNSYQLKFIEKIN